MNNSIEIPFDMNCPTGAQIASALAKLPPGCCGRHPQETLQLDVARTIAATLKERIVSYTATFDRCPSCPYNFRDGDIVVKDCAADELAAYKRWFKPKLDTGGKPLPERHAHERLVPEDCAINQFRRWASRTNYRCGDQLLNLRESTVKPIISLGIALHYRNCLQCALEALGITPDDARASFDRLVIDPPILQKFLEICRAYADAPQGVLLLLGNNGTGKTHLAIAILRELLRQGKSGLLFIKHRHFLARYWHASRPLAFREAPPESPLACCQGSSLLVYDEVTPSTDNNRPYEDVLLDLFEARIGHSRPSIITSNLNPAELEGALGSRLFDRLRRAAFAVLEFGFESKRKSLNVEYLSRISPPAS